MVEDGSSEFGFSWGLLQRVKQKESVSVYLISKVDLSNRGRD